MGRTLSLVNMSLNTVQQGGCMYVTGNGANVTTVSFYSCGVFRWLLLLLLSPSESQ